MNYEPLIRAEQLVGDNKRADGIIAGSTTSITDHMCVAFCQSRELGRIEPRIHAGEDRKMTSRRHGETAFVTEPFRIALIRCQDIIKNLGHGPPPSDDAKHLSNSAACPMMPE